MYSQLLQAYLQYTQPTREYVLEIIRFLDNRQNISRTYCMWSCNKGQLDAGRTETEALLDPIWRAWISQMEHTHWRVIVSEIYSPKHNPLTPNVRKLVAKCMLSCHFLWFMCCQCSSLLNPSWPPQHPSFSPIFIASLESDISAPSSVLFSGFNNRNVL